jgi:poly-beta-1,6-N-acetyl-D-glucosamine synthase
MQESVKSTTSYVIISPCRNEADFLSIALESVAAQSIKPSKWVIVDDGSADATPEILREFANKHSWVHLVTRNDRGTRSVGPGVIEAFYAGYEVINADDYEFICKLDLDLDLPPRYFELLMKKMSENPRLATVSGKAYIRQGKELVNEGHGDESSIGASKFYRTVRFKQLGGFIREVMWDGIDCHLCRMKGWTAQSIDEPELRFLHMRPMGSSQQNIFVGRMRHGAGQYFMGSGFIWMVATAVYRIPERPFVIGGLYILWGWLKAKLNNSPQYNQPGFRQYLRRYQRRALLIGKQKAILEIQQNIPFVDK